MPLSHLPDIPVLPCTEIESDEPQLETILHLRQLILLFKCLEWLWRDRTDYFAAGNMSIYYNVQQLKNRDFRGPDFFVVLDTQKYDRKSWVVWNEGGRYPNVIIEVLSQSTAETDRTTKKRIYEQVFKTPEYFWVYPDTLEFQGFRLVGKRYQEIPLTAAGLRWSEELQLFLRVHGEELRYFHPSGDLVLTPEEEAELLAQQALAEEQRAIAARQLAETERLRADAAQQEAELAQRQADVAQQEVEVARQAVEKAQQQIEVERRRAELAETKLAELQRQLGSSPGDPEP
jgi:Uma2 family endonuclease